MAAGNQQRKKQNQSPYKSTALLFAEKTDPAFIVRDLSRAKTHPYFDNREFGLHSSFSCSPDDRIWLDQFEPDIFRYGSQLQHMKRPEALKHAIRLVLFVIPLAVLGNVIFTLFTTSDSGFSAIINLHPGWLFGAIFLSLAPWVLAAMRVAVWNRFFNLQLNAKKIFEVVFANDVASAATPTAIGGGYAKLGFLIFHGVKPGLAASIMVIGSMEEYLVLAIIVPLCWYLYPPENIGLFNIIGDFFSQMPSSPSHIFIIVAATALTILTLYAIPITRKWLIKLGSPAWWQRRILTPLRKLVSDFSQAMVVISKGGKRLFALNMILAGVQWGMRYSVFTAMAYGLGLSPHPVQFFVLQAVLFSMLNLVPTPGAIGGAEVGFALIFKNIIPPDILIVAAGAWRFITTYLQLIVAALMMAYLEKPRFGCKKDKKELQVKVIRDEELSNGTAQPYSPVKAASPEKQLVK